MIEIFIALNSVDGQYSIKYDLDCEGDGEFEYAGLTENKNCFYKKNSGNHQIWVRGEIPAIFLCSLPKNDSMSSPYEIDSYHNHNIRAVVSIDSWGNVSWKSMVGMAAHCIALNKLPEASPDLSQVKDMSFMFRFASSFNQPLEAWNVSNVTNMSGMFLGASARSTSRSKRGTCQTSPVWGDVLSC